ncbi:cation:proton antiporter [Candidatus Micrarchaeota archaeon]|nr:cation:proton antiporter [Candidatus Micrarchaeota archaeon]
MSTFLEIGLLILFAAIGGMLAIRFRQPAVLGLLLIGALVGPNTMGIISQSETVNLFAEIGAVLLLFTIGVQFSVSKLMRLGIKVLLIAMFKLAMVFFLSYWLALALGLQTLTALLVGVILAITSTAFVVRILEQKSLINKQEVPILVATLIFEDVFAIFVLAVVSSVKSAGAFTPLKLFASILFSLAILGIAYLVLLRVLKPIFEWLTSYRAEESMVFAALSLGVGLSYIAELVGLNSATGAFLAGSLVASLPRGDILEKAVSPFAVLFTSLFFISMGMLVNFTNVYNDLWIIAILLLGNLLFKFVGMSTSSYLFGFPARSAVFSGMAMLSVGEFSLLIAKEGSTLVSAFDLVGVTSVIIFLSSLSTSFTLDRVSTVHRVIDRIMPRPVRKTGRVISHYLCAVCEFFEPGGPLFMRMERMFERTLPHIAFLSVVIGLAAFGWLLFGSDVIDFFGSSIPLFGLVELFALILLVFGGYRLLVELLYEFKTFVHSRSLRHMGLGKMQSAILRMARIVGTLLIIMSLPFVVAVLELEAFIPQVVFALVIGIVLWIILDIRNDHRGPLTRGKVFFKR